MNHISSSSTMSVVGDTPLPAIGSSPREAESLLCWVHKMSQIRNVTQQVVYQELEAPFTKHF
eukprot:scaffold275540_cov24-Attheya_sp.AAC.1